MTDDKRLTVLVVDDEPTLCDIIVFDLEDAGYKTLVAHGGYEALEIIKSQRVDAIISDIRMQLGTGIELLEGVKRLMSESPVVLLMSGFSDLTLEDAYDKGAEVVLSKPVKPEQLLTALESALQDAADRFLKRSANVPANVQIDVTLSGDMEPRKARKFNLGRGGMFIGVDAPPSVRPGHVVGFCLRFDGPGLTSIEGDGLVRWIRRQTTSDLPAGIGLEFISLADHCREKVVQVIDGIKTRSFIPKC